MTRRSLGELTVNIVAADASFVQGMDRVERKAVRTAQATAAANRKAAKDSEQAWQEATAKMGGLSDKQHAAAMRGLPAQFTDIVVSLQGGQNPLTVFLQQGGQIKDMFGGVGAAVTAVTRGIAAMVSPVTILGAAVVTMAYGWYAGAQESQKFLVALETTGNRVGTTVGQMNDMAASMDKLSGVTQGQAAAALTVFATQAGVGADRLQQYTTTALAWERATGESADKVAEKFKKIADDPVKGLLELNKQMGFLTNATFEQVKALQEAGKETDAARVAQDAYDAAVATAAKNLQANLGYVERGWNAVKGATLDAIDAVKQFGREQGIATQLTDTTARIAELQGKGVKLAMDLSEVSSYAERDLYNLKQREIQLQKNLVAETNTAKAKTAARAQEDALNDLSEAATRAADRRTKRQIALNAAEEKWGALARTNAEAAKKYAIVIAGIEEQYKDPKTSRGRKAGRTDEERQAERDRVTAATYMKNLTAEGDGRKNLTKYGQLLYDVGEGRVKLTVEQLELAKEAALEADKRVTAEQLVNAAYETRKSLLDEGRALTESLLSPQERYYKQIEGLNHLLTEGVIQQETYGKAVRKYYEDLTGVAAEYGQTVASGLQNILGDELAKGLDASFKGILTSFLKMLLQMETRALSANLMGLLGLGPGNTGGAGSLLGKLFTTVASGLAGGGVAASSQYSLAGSSSGGLGLKLSGFRAAGGNVDPGSLYRVNELGPELLNMGGKDYLMMGGSGGYVKPLGAATTEKRSAGNITVVNQTTGRVDNVEQRQLTHDDVVLIIQEQTPKVMASQSQNANSPFSRTMQGSFNVSRRR